MTLPQNDPIRDAHERFNERHDALRQDLLSRLGDLDPAVPASRLRIRLNRRQIIHWSAAIAAMALIVVSVWFILFRSTSIALADLPARLAACKSVRVDGWIASNGRHFPVQIYVDKGYYFHPTTIAQENVTYSGYEAADAHRYISVQNHNKIAVVGASDPLAAELRGQFILQALMPAQLFGNATGNYRKTSTGDANETTGDCFQRREPDGSRRVLWLDPRTHLPEQMALYQHGPRGEEQTALLSIYTNNNAPRSAETPMFDPPAGYTVIHQDQNIEAALGIGGGSAGDETCELLTELNLEDQAILICWSRYKQSNGVVSEQDLGGPVGRSLTLDVRADNGGTPYRAYHLRDDAWKGHHARWSLLVPQKPLESIGPASTTIRVANSSIRLDIIPLRLPRNRLVQIVPQLQHITDPAGQTFTLDQLVKLADQCRSSR